MRAGKQPDAAVTNHLDRCKERRITGNLEFNQFEVSLSTLVDEVDSAASIRSSRDQPRRNGHLIGPISTSAARACTGYRSFQNYFCTGVVCRNLLLGSMPTPILPRPIAIARSVTPLVVVINSPEDHLGQIQTDPYFEV